MEFTMETAAGRLYAIAHKGLVNYIEIGYVDECGFKVPLAAVETPTKKLHPEADEKEIFRVIYDLNDPNEHINQFVKGGKHEEDNE